MYLNFAIQKDQRIKLNFGQKSFEFDVNNSGVIFVCYYFNNSLKEGFYPSLRFGMSTIFHGYSLELYYNSTDGLWIISISSIDHPKSLDIK